MYVLYNPQVLFLRQRIITDAVFDRDNGLFLTIENGNEKRFYRYSMNLDEALHLQKFRDPLGYVNDEYQDNMERLDGYDVEFRGNPVEVNYGMRLPISSSLINRAYHDKDNGLLYVDFSGARPDMAFTLDAGDVDLLRNAASPGRHFIENIAPFAEQTIVDIPRLPPVADTAQNAPGWMVW